MAFRAAYGPRDSIQNAIDTGIIPKGSMIFTKEDSDASELFLYTPQGELKSIAQKHKFNSIDEAIAWTQKYNCVGEILSVKDNSSYSAYIVQEDNSLSLIAGQESVVEYGSSLEFPTIGKPNRLYIATSENNGKGAIYRWDVTDGKYYILEVPAGSGIEDGTILNGGGAFG